MDLLRPSCGYRRVASDKATAAVSASRMAAASAPVRTYATVQTFAAGTADITAIATLADGSRIDSVTHLVDEAAPGKSYTLVLSPATVTVTAGGAAQTVTAALRRSDGVADLTNWTWWWPTVMIVDGNATLFGSLPVARPNTVPPAV